jgi:GNAT superfamily N-acetyltransferase
MEARPPVSMPKPIMLDAAAAARCDRLADILIDAVKGGASVNFLLPFERSSALAFWDRVIAGVAASSTRLFALEDPERILGTVQLIPAPQPNQAHRADIAKLLVSRRARRQGIATALMLSVEDEARRLGRTLIMLDTETDSAADWFYRRLGYQPFGKVPLHARRPDGQLADTTFFFKQLTRDEGMRPST